MQFYILALQGRISTRTSGPVDAQRLPRLRRLLRKLSAIGCRVLDRICTRLYLTQIDRRSANGYRAMQLRILTRQGGVNLCSGTVDAQRLPRLRRLLRKLSAIGCRVLDRICTRLYLTQITRRSDNGYRAMQFRILARQGGVNACALARWTHSAFRPAIFCFLLEIPIHFIFRLHPKYTKSQSSKTPAPVSRSGDSALCERGSLRSIY